MCVSACMCVCVCVFVCTGEESQHTWWVSCNDIGVSHYFCICVVYFFVAHSHTHAHTRTVSHRASVLVVHLSLTAQNSDVFLWADGIGYISVTDGVCSPRCTPPFPHSINLSVSLLFISIQAALAVSLYIVLFLKGYHIRGTKWNLQSNNRYCVKKKQQTKNPAEINKKQDSDITGIRNCRQIVCVRFFFGLFFVFF